MREDLRRIYKICKDFSIPPTDPFIQGLTYEDVVLLEYLDLFQDPEKLRAFKNRYEDESFNEYWNEEAPEVDYSNINPEDIEDWEVVSE